MKSKDDWSLDASKFNFAVDGLVIALKRYRGAADAIAIKCDKHVHGELQSLLPKPVGNELPEKQTYIPKTHKRVW